MLLLLSFNLFFFPFKITDLCFSFGISQGTLVKKTKPASVHVYDYYETGECLLATGLPQH